MIPFRGQFWRSCIYAESVQYDKKEFNCFRFSRAKFVAMLPLNTCVTYSLFQKVKNKGTAQKGSSAAESPSKHLYSTNLKSEKKTSIAKRFYSKENSTLIKRLSPCRFLAQTTFKKHYEYIVCEDLILKQKIKNITELPKIKKLIISTSSKLVVSDKKNMVSVLIAVEKITGQKIKKTQAKKSIAAFKLRENQLIGCKVTLRGHSLFPFLDKVVRILLPRIRDFEGLQVDSLDYQGNPNIGINSFILFAELENYFEFFGFLGGINLSIVTSPTRKQEVSFFTSSLQLPSFFENQRLKAFLSYS